MTTARRQGTYDPDIAVLIGTTLVSLGQPLTRESRGFSTELHYALIHYITKIMFSCFSYILHLFSVWLAKFLAIFGKKEYII